MKNGKRTNDCPVRPADILIPDAKVPIDTWGTVACDQFTQDPDYWRRVEARTAGVPSTAHLMLPEIYLTESQAQIDARVEKINRTMRDYLDNGVFQELKDSFVLTVRQFESGKTLTGLVAAVDLEQYDFAPGSVSPIRATEKTVADRIPPRVRIRRGACLEMPHILILIDDPENKLIEPIFAEVLESGTVPVYDASLMEHGGRITGYRLPGRKYFPKVRAEIAKLADPKSFCARNGLSEGTAPIVLAMGDGNHSLATAKTLYEQDKNPAFRYALAEIVNIHDPGIEFLPIHRVVIGADPEKLREAAKCEFGELLKTVPAGTPPEPGYHRIRFLSRTGKEDWLLSDRIHMLAAGALTPFLEKFASTVPGALVDYIHGDGEAQALSELPANSVFLLPALAKSELFRTVAACGALPKKTFSMGSGNEKRYYFECRAL